jgi:hypothetical protein
VRSWHEWLPWAGNYKKTASPLKTHPVSWLISASGSALGGNKQYLFFSKKSACDGNQVGSRRGMLDILSSYATLDNFEKLRPINAFDLVLSSFAFCVGWFIWSLHPSYVLLTGFWYHL